MINESLFISFKNETLHLKQISKSSSAIPVLCIPGAIENGKIFYSEKSNKGLAYYLANNGYQAFVADFRGKGKSYPKIDKESSFGQFEIITEDIKIFIDFIIEKTDSKKINILSHSWGGVLISSFLARNPEYIRKIASMVYIAVKRRVMVVNMHRIFVVTFIWNFLTKLIVKIFSYLPSHIFTFASESESKQSVLDSINWVKNNPWIDQIDSFNYEIALKNITLPATLHLTGISDLSLGNPIDVQLFINESGHHPYQFKILGKEFGNNLDYNHINILTAREAYDDHFPLIIKWFKKFERIKC